MQSTGYGAGSRATVAVRGAAVLRCCGAATYRVQKIWEAHVHLHELVKLDQIIAVVGRKLSEGLIGKHFEPWPVNHLEQLFYLRHLYVSHAVRIVHTEREADHLWRSAGHKNEKTVE